MTSVIPNTPIDDFALRIAGRIDLQDTIEEDQKEEQQIQWVQLLVHFDKKRLISFVQKENKL